MGNLAGAYVGSSLAEIFRMVPDLEVAGIDMPLHLLDAPTRDADTLTRKALGPERGRSVFPALPQFVIEEEWLDRSLEDVNAECRVRYGRAFSRQSLGLRRKIAEVNAAFATGHPVIEVHPELCFATMNEAQPMMFSKKAWGGQQERIALLERVGIALSEYKLPQDVCGIAPDDIIDAAAAAWSARRYLQGNAESLPANPDHATTPAIWA